MAKGNIYKLIDSRGYVVSWIEFTDDYCTGVCYEPFSWNPDKPGDHRHCESSYVCDFYCKPDGCTHWWFRGEDYDSKITKEFDSYYHLCGTDTFMQHIRSMCFVWKVAAMVGIKDDNKYKTYIAENYFNHQINELIKLMLTGYEIKKEK